MGLWSYAPSVCATLWVPPLLEFCLSRLYLFIGGFGAAYWFLAWPSLFLMALSQTIAYTGLYSFSLILFVIAMVAGESAGPTRLSWWPYCVGGVLAVFTAWWPSRHLVGPEMALTWFFAPWMLP